MRQVNFQVSEDLHHTIEYLMRTNEITSMTKVFAEAVRIFNLLTQAAEKGFSVPCAFNPSKNKVTSIGPYLEYLKNVVERSEDNMIIPFTKPLVIEK